MQAAVTKRHRKLTLLNHSLAPGGGSGEYSIRIGPRCDESNCGGGHVERIIVKISAAWCVPISPPPFPAPVTRISLVRLFAWIIQHFSATSQMQIPALRGESCLFYNSRPRPNCREITSTTAACDPTVNPVAKNKGLQHGGARRLRDKITYNDITLMGRNILIAECTRWVPEMRNDHGNNQCREPQS